MLQVNLLTGESPYRVLGSGEYSSEEGVLQLKDRAIGSFFLEGDVVELQRLDDDSICGRCTIAKVTGRTIFFE